MSDLKLVIFYILIIITIKTSPESKSSQRNGDVNFVTGKICKLSGENIMISRKIKNNIEFCEIFRVRFLGEINVYKANNIEYVCIIPNLNMILMKLKTGEIYDLDNPRKIFECPQLIKEMEDNVSSILKTNPLRNVFRFNGSTNCRHLPDTEKKSTPPTPDQNRDHTKPSMNPYHEECKMQEWDPWQVVIGIIIGIIACRLPWLLSKLVNYLNCKRNRHPRNADMTVSESSPPVKCGSNDTPNSVDSEVNAFQNENPAADESTRLFTQDSNDHDRVNLDAINYGNESPTIQESIIWIMEDSGNTGGVSPDIKT